MNLVTSNLTTTSIDLSWTASTDNFEVTGYDVLIDGVVNQTITGTTARIKEATDPATGGALINPMKDGFT